MTFSFVHFFPSSLCTIYAAAIQQFPQCGRNKGTLFDSILYNAPFQGARRATNHAVWALGAPAIGGGMQGFESPDGRTIPGTLRTAASLKTGATRGPRRSCANGERCGSRSGCALAVRK